MYILSVAEHKAYLPTTAITLLTLERANFQVKISLPNRLHPKGFPLLNIDYYVRHLGYSLPEEDSYYQDWINDMENRTTPTAMGQASLNHAIYETSMDSAGADPRDLSTVGPLFIDLAEDMVDGSYSETGVDDDNPGIHFTEPEPSSSCAEGSHDLGNTLTYRVGHQDDEVDWARYTDVHQLFPSANPQSSYELHLLPPEIFRIGVVGNQTPVIHPDEASKGAQFIRLCNQGYVSLTIFSCP